MSYFFDLEENGRVIRAGTLGGVGTNFLRKRLLDKYNLPHSYRDDFENSMQKIRNEKVDLHIGNHVTCNDSESKFAKFADSTMQMPYDMIERGE